MKHKTQSSTSPLVKMVQQRFFKCKRWLANALFADVMKINATDYARMHRKPELGIRFFYGLKKYWIIENVAKGLRAGNLTGSLFDELAEFHVSLIGDYGFDSLAREIGSRVRDAVIEHEMQNNVLVDKEKLYFLLALSSVSSGNTIAATANWELAMAEAARKGGAPPTVANLVNGLPTKFTTLLNPIRNRFADNPFFKAVQRRTFILEFEPLLNSLNGLDALSLLSSGLRNVHVNTLIDSYGMAPEVPRMYAQELINNLSVLNEALLKRDVRITSRITNEKERMLANMLNKLSEFNPTVNSKRSSLAGSTATALSTEAEFNANYANVLATMEGTSLNDDEFKAYALHCLMFIRNKVLHDLNPALVYYNDKDLFIKTIGLLLICPSVIKSI